LRAEDLRGCLEDGGRQYEELLFNKASWMQGKHALYIPEKCMLPMK